MMASDDDEAPAPCKICPGLVTTDHPALLCDMCNEWLHIKCANVSPNLYKEISKKKKMVWFCDNCSDYYKNQKGNKIHASIQTDGPEISDGIGSNFTSFKIDMLAELKTLIPSIVQSEMNEHITEKQNPTSQHSNFTKHSIVFQPNDNT